MFLFFRVSSLLSLFCNSIFSLRRCSNIRTWLFRAGGRLFWSSTGPRAFCWDGQQKTYEKHKYSIVNAIGLSHRNSTTTKRHTVDGQKCCTTKDDDYPSIYRVLTIPGGDRRISEPSTVATSNFGMRIAPSQDATLAY